MASRDELYAKFGITAEAAQLFETALGTFLLGAEGLKRGWHEAPDRTKATETVSRIEKSTLGRLLKSTQGVIEFDDALIAAFQKALATRNRLMHGFYLRHDFSIQTDEGRDEMINDLEEMHTSLFNAWQLADTMSGVLLNYLMELRTDPDSAGRGPATKIQFKIRQGNP